jgi:hypothetical protein
VNLNTNFLYPEEMRSASMVSLKSLLQISAGIIPLIIIILIAHAHIKLEEVRSALELEKNQWSNVEVRKEKAEKMSAELRTVTASATELNGWRRSRIDWNPLFEGLRRHVPPTIQLKVMTARHSIELDAKNQLQRVSKVILNGRCAGPDADAKVQNFRKVLGEQEPFAALARSVIVSGLVEDLEPGSREGDRVFQIEIDFQPRLFHETSGK